MTRKFILVLSFCAAFAGLFAQHTAIDVVPNHYFKEGKELYDLHQWSASFQDFEQYLKHASETEAGMKEDAEYYMACIAYEMRRTDAEDKLNVYLKNYPSSPYKNRVLSLIGMLEYEQKHYDKALEYFRQMDETYLPKDEKEESLFARGFANLKTNNVDKALVIFKTLKSISTTRQAEALYYTGYCEYLTGNYEKALPDLLAIEQIQPFDSIAPYYTAQIYYAKRNFPEMQKRAEMLLKKYPDNKKNGEIYRMLGEKEYVDGNYSKAVDYLKKYEMSMTQVLRHDLYYLGISYLKTYQPAEAVKYLSKVTTERDEMTESAYLQIGNAYISMGEKDNARMAFEAALQTNFNKDVREEALYNYALTTYETNTAFGESVKAFEQFIAEYPRSKNINKAYEYLSTVYLTSKNYEEAYQSISKITNLTPSLSETKQYLEYQLGIESFASKDYNRAIEFFTQALETALNGKYSIDCLFWRAESYYQTKDYAKSVADYNAFLNQPAAKNNPNYVEAFYNLGYAYFSQKKYNESLNSFLAYTANENDKTSASYFDAMNRIGDVYYSNRDFAKADEYYTKAMQSLLNGDYAIFQSAYMAGINKNYEQKITQLDLLLTKYPHSDYAPNAMYEKARAYILLEKNDKAIETYKNLIDAYPNNNFAAKAELETGMIYFNQHDYTNAISAFKKVIAEYPASEEAKVALESLETIYVNTNKVDEYAKYTQTLGKDIENKTSLKVDSMQFVAGEKLYLEKHYTEAIEQLNKYLMNQYPNGKYCNTALYYLADCYYEMGNKDKALEEYALVLEERGNPHAEEAALRAAEISFDNKDYEAALRYFHQLSDVAQTTENKNIARLGVLRTSYFLNSMEETVKIASEIIADSKSTAEMRNEALLNRSKAYLQQNKPNDALKDLKEMSIDTRTSVGAEAKYIVSEVYFKLNRLNDAEKEILDFAKIGTSFPYWMAHSFILLSDIYQQKGDDFQAKQYLLSLQKNYTVKDEIQDMIITRLNQIEKRAKERIVK